MLDDISEKVLNALIKKCNGDPQTEISISEKDFVFPKLNLHLIYSVCEYLYKQGYIHSFSSLYFDTVELEVTLTYKGFSYFEYKNIERKEFIKRFLLSKISDIIVSAIVAYLTVIITG